MTTNTQVNSHQAMSRSLNRNSTSRREWHDIFKVMKGKNLQPRILYPARLSFRFDGEIKRFPNKQKLREFSTIKPPLQQMLKELLQAGNTRKGKDLQKVNPKYLKCKWIKCTNQKTQTGWVDENKGMYALSLTTSLCLTNHRPTTTSPPPHPATNCM